MRCVRFSQDGRYLAVGFMDGTTQIHDVEERANQWYVHTTLRYIRLLIDSHRSDLYAYQSSGGYICSAVCFSLNSDYLATAGQDGQIRVSYRFFTILTARHDIHADLHRTAVASAITDDLYTLKLDLGYQEQAYSHIS